MNNIESKNPIRIRGKTFLLEYKSNKLLIIKEKILHKFSNCKYIIKKEESNENAPRTLVFLEFSDIQDIYTSRFKLIIDGVTLEGIYRVVRDKELAKKYILKSNGKKDLYTDFEKSIIKENSFIFKQKNEVVINKTLPTSISTKKTNQKNRIS